VSEETEAGMGVQAVSAEPAYRSKGKSLAVLQVNCKSIYNKAIEFWNLVDTYNPDVIIGIESWLKEDINSAEVFRADFTTFRRGGGGVLMSYKFHCLYGVVGAEMIAIEVKGMDPKYLWEIIGIYRAPNEDMLTIERLVASTQLM
jgi:hypothetical protein